MTDRSKCHVYMTFEQLAERFGIPGRPLKVWVEPDQDYIHIITEWEGERGTEPGPESGFNFYWVGPGNYVEATTIPR